MWTGSGPAISTSSAAAASRLFGVIASFLLVVVQQRPLLHGLLPTFPRHREFCSWRFLLFLDRFGCCGQWPDARDLSWTTEVGNLLHPVHFHPNEMGPALYHHADTLRRAHALPYLKR